MRILDPTLYDFDGDPMVPQVLPPLVSNVPAVQPLKPQVIDTTGTLMTLQPAPMASGPKLNWMMIALVALGAYVLFNRPRGGRSSW